jgi:RNA-directed DNA polymerase
MSGQRQKNQPKQEELAFPAESRSDAPKAAEQGTETLVAKRQSESLAGTERLMEEVCELENCKQALQRVKTNKGSPGVDGMTVDELPEYLKQHELEIGEQLRNGTYEPQPVKRVEIPKPDGGQWSAQARHSLCAGSVCPASGAAGSAEALGPDVLRTQPRFSTGA